MKKGLLGLVCAMAVFSLAACSSGGSKDASKEVDTSEYKPYGKYDETVTLTIGRSPRDLNLLPKGDTLSDNEATRYLKQEGNIVLKSAWESADAAKKLSLDISTGDVPDVMLVSKKTMQELYDNDLIYDLTDIYDKTASDDLKDRIGSTYASITDIAKIDGKLMGIPIPKADYEHSIVWVRRDWVKKVGAELPKTKEDLYNLAKTFVEKDASGTGKTVGMALATTIAGNYGGTFDADPYFSVNNAFPRQWIKGSDGKVEYGSNTEETKKTLEEFAQLYKDGIIDQQFASRKEEDNRALVSNGQLGIVVGGFWDSKYNLNGSFDNDHNVDWVALNIPENEEGNFVTYSSRPDKNVFVVVSKKTAHPEAAIRAINLQNDFFQSTTKEAKEYREEHMKGQVFYWFHLPIAQKWDFADFNKDNYAQFEDAIKTGDDSKVSDTVKPVVERYKEMQEKSIDQVDSAVWGEVLSYTEGIKATTAENTDMKEMAFFGQTPTMDQKWVNLQKLEDEMFLKIISGEKPISYFDDYVAQWKKLGGDQITKEVQEFVDKGVLVN